MAVAAVETSKTIATETRSAGLSLDPGILNVF